MHSEWNNGQLKMCSCIISMNVSKINLFTNVTLSMEKSRSLWSDECDEW